MSTQKKGKKNRKRKKKKTNRQITTTTTKENRRKNNAVREEGKEEEGRESAAAKAVLIAAGSSQSRLYDGVASDAYILAALLARTQLGISGSLGLAAIHHSLCSAQLCSGYLKCVIAINSLILIFRKTKLTIPACLSLHSSLPAFLCLSICLCSAFFQLFGCVLRGWHFLSSEAHKPHSSSANWKNH